ncbi:MAG TPA: S9 family peptidase [Steroidobacteraceae bacterium]|jgi:dipeptidyl aminopeptidase/acylaminoacyl peptidase|nr:S9 family peptidase [Steroidobacteraceae bacterium]
MKRIGGLVVGCFFAQLAFGAPHTVDELLKEPRIRGADLSPDGAHVAIAFRSDDQPGDVIGVIEVARLGQPDAVRRFSLGEKDVVSVEWLQWATPSRLLIGISLTSRLPSMTTLTKGLPLGSRVYATNLDGSEPVMLFSNASNVQRYGFNLSEVIDIPASDPDHVIMPGWSGIAYDLFRVNIHTGEATRIATGKGGTFGWDTEDGRPALRYDSNLRGTVVSVYGRSGERDDWSLLTTYRRDVDKLDWQFAGDAPGAGKIFVRTRASETDTDAIYRYDIGKKALEELVAAAPGFDMDDALMVNGKYLGASYISDRLTYLLADPQLQKHLNGIDAYFNKSANIAIGAVDANATHLLLYVSGPAAPGDYYVYDAARANLQFLMSARPWLQPERLAPMEVRRTPTRDGSAITTYLTWPAGARTGLPVVVMPHGGPEARDFISLDLAAQAFAAQGWLVVQPNFRGSGGYGRAFAESGYRQWGQRMQDDVTDSVEDLVKQGIADRSRIVIYGASYGGFAALAGAVVTPDLYRAAVSQSGVCDLVEMLKWVRNQDGADSPSYTHWVKSIGDPAADAAALQAASPRLHAAEIRIPILLIHGDADNIVPIEQSQLMHKALKKAGKNVRLTTYKMEGHGGWSQENALQNLEEIITFFEPYLARRAAAN